MAKLSSRILRLLCTGFLMVVASSAGAQSAASYPNKPVRIILPYAPGGTTFAVSNIFADRLSKNLGQSFIVEPRSGGDTIIGTTAAANATPDGYTLLATTSSILVNYGLQPNLPYDTLKDLTPISPLSRSESALAVHPSVPTNDLKEFISYAKANPGKLNAVSVGPLSVLNYQRFMNSTGTKFTIVSYKGGGQGMIDFLAGTVPVYISAVLNVQSFIKAGKLKGLAVSGNKRAPVVPDVPTFAEAGLKDYDASNWLTLFAPSKTPKDIIQKMNTEVRRAQEVPEVISALADQGIAPYPMTVAEAEKFIRGDANRIVKLVKESGLKAGDY